MERVDDSPKITNINLRSDCSHWSVVYRCAFYRCRSWKPAYTDVMMYMGNYFGVFLGSNLSTVRNFSDPYGCSMWWSLVELCSVCDHCSVQFSSVAQSCPTLCDPMDCMQHARPPCPSPTPEVYSNSCPSSRWSHPTISSSVVSFSSCPQSFPASGSFPKSQLSTSGDHCNVV